ncbi:thiamine diphosphokinase [uncultured Gemmiger sp.]|uniref:thiamine diphosphokinase n=1 Tax=uncultured Gemmiger sp. TaxID=1623490 RepID=UPI0025F0D551|nr:thiamine diphosphokinase [uncultured Gemmiger sp.]
MYPPIQHAVILSACPVTSQLRHYLTDCDCIIACDAGYRNAEHLGITPDLIVGDFDSAPKPTENDHTIVLPHVKDDTDTHFAARWLVERGAKRVTMLGALGGKRLEHTLANLATGLFLAKSGVRTRLADERSELHYLLPGHPLTLERADWMYLSVFPLDGPLTGVDISGVFYPLQNAVLAPNFPLGVSNEFTAPQARLACTGGSGLVVLTRADQPM